MHLIINDQTVPSPYYPSNRGFLMLSLTERRILVSIFMTIMIIIGYKYGWYNAYKQCLIALYTEYRFLFIILLPIIIHLNFTKNSFLVTEPKLDPNVDISTLDSNPETWPFYGYTNDGHMHKVQLRIDEFGYKEWCMTKHAHDICHECLIKRNRNLINLGNGLSIYPDATEDLKDGQSKIMGIITGTDIQWGIMKPPSTPIRKIKLESDDDILYG